MSRPVAGQGHGAALEWIEGWLKAKHGESSLTYERYTAVWQRLKVYLSDKGVTSLDGITRQLCFDYYLWRQGAKRNTVGFELRILSLILQEAVKRSIIPANPAIGLGIKRQTPRIKPELTPAVMDEILAEVEKRKKHRHFYRTSFLLARYLGCRISETRFPLADVNFAAGTLTLRMKGDKVHTTVVHPKLLPILEEMRDRGDAWTFSEPTDAKEMAALWYRFFRRKKWQTRIPGICFHALRVSVISQLARANVSEAKARRYVAHSSTAVHAIYQRVQLADLLDCTRALH